MTTPNDALPVEAPRDEQTIGVTLDEVRAEMDELGLAKFAAAQTQAINRKLATRLQAAMARIDDLERQKSS